MANAIVFHDKKCALEKGDYFLSFPYVCPEPVLVKCSFLYINGAKSGVLPHLDRAVIKPSASYGSRSRVFESVKVSREVCNKVSRQSFQTLLSIGDDDANDDSVLLKGYLLR